MREQAALWSLRINQVVEAIVAGLMLSLVLVVWIGVMDRYYFSWQLPWPEVVARYLMIWAAMLAVSSGISRREHIGLTAFIDILPEKLRHALLVLIDCLSLSLFAYLAYFGIGFALSGAPREAMIFGVSLLPFYAAIPVAAGVCCVQLVLVLVRDLGSHIDRPPTVDKVGAI